MTIVNCGICSKEFYVKPSHLRLGWGKFCSVKCRSKSQFSGKNVSCYNCSKKIYRPNSKLLRSKSGKYFCSKSCQTKWRNNYFANERHPNWKHGESVYRKMLLNSIRKKVCVVCGIRDTRVLAVHHRDGDRRNNKLDNLVWLCLNCHYLAHNDDKIEAMVAVA